MFNSGCGTCSTIGEKVQEEAGDVFTVRSLAELEIQQLLNQALPDGWEWEPMLMEVSDGGKDIRVFSGVFMRLRLIQLVGILRALRIGTLVYQSVRPLVSLQERRSFLQYSGGLMAGLAVLGLRPMQSQVEAIVDDSEGKTTAKQLEGAELEEAIAEATGGGEYGLLRSHLLEKGHTEEQGQAVGYLVESTKFAPVLYVTVPYSHAGTAEVSQVKYMRQDTKIETTMGTLHNKDGELASVSVFEVVDGQVEHTKTFERKDGTIVEKPAGGMQSETQLMDLGDANGVHVSNCDICMNGRSLSSDLSRGPRSALRGNDGRKLLGPLRSSHILLAPAGGAAEIVNSLWLPYHISEGRPR